MANIPASLFDLFLKSEPRKPFSSSGTSTIQSSSSSHKHTLSCNFLSPFSGYQRPRLLHLLAENNVSESSFFVFFGWEQVWIPMSRGAEDVLEGVGDDLI